VFVSYLYCFSGGFYTHKYHKYSYWLLLIALRGRDASHRNGLPAISRGYFDTVTAAVVIGEGVAAPGLIDFVPNGLVVEPSGKVGTLCGWNMVFIVFLVGKPHSLGGSSSNKQKDTGLERSHIKDEGIIRAVALAGCLQWFLR